jgi:hypothetical protein
MRRLSLLDFLIGMIENPPPGLLVHESPGIHLTRRKLAFLQFPKGLPVHQVFGVFVAFGADAIQIDAKSVSRRGAAHPTVPTAVVPRHAQIEVMN